MALAVVLLALVCAGLLLRLYTLERDVKDCARQLRARPDAPVRMAAPNRAGEELLAAINDLQRLGQEREADYRRQERTIRQQIANVSHDLRTPLTSILGYLQLLEGKDLTSEERREYLEVVRGRAKALQSMITSFYDLSRLEGGEFPLTREPVDLYQILSQLVADFYGDFEASGFAMTVELEEGLPNVTADPAGTLRIFTNLIRNALEHGRDRMEIRLERRDGEILSSFSNDAQGLTQEDMEHVFDRFYTADKMRTGRSTGLGLAIVKAVAQQMGCRVSARLEDGMFTVEVGWSI